MTEITSLTYISGYPVELRKQVESLLVQGKLELYLAQKYPDKHAVNNDKKLREYVLRIKNQYLKKSAPVKQIKFSQKLNVIENALGINLKKIKVQGAKLRPVNEILISSLFKTFPEKFLKMIVVHELAHLKIRAHDKSFYQLCNHMLPDYAQLEFDTRVYLTLMDFKERNLYT